MDLSVSLIDQIWFLRVCHHISNAVCSIHSYFNEGAELGSFNEGAELGSSVVTRELHHDGERFRSFYRMTQKSLELSPFLNKQGNGLFPNEPHSICFPPHAYFNWYSVLKSLDSSFLQWRYVYDRPTNDTAC